MSDVTQILAQLESGDAASSDQLLPLVYKELRKLASARLTQEQPGQTLQATALVHEAYVRLVDVERAQKWQSRGHFFAAAAEAMRRILIDNARHRNSKRRGGDFVRQELNEADAVDCSSDELLELDEALTRFERLDRQAAELVKLRYFAGLSMKQASEMLGVSMRTAERNWTYAKTWLHAELNDNSTLGQ